MLDATVSADYVARQSFNGSVNYADPQLGSVSFTSTYDADYDAAPSLTALAGTFTGEVGMETASVTIESNGSFTGTLSNGCTVTGVAAPRSCGNVFNISISVGDAPCEPANTTLDGIAVFDATEGLVVVVALNGSRTDGVVFVGTKS